MSEITSITGRCVPVRGDDIDTDRIIPARYMKGITFDDLGKYAFHDARRTDDGEPNDHPFNDIRYKGASILLVNRNFGCGSSREHAPQALIRSGIKAIVGESFAEIFAGNCTANGVPVATLESGEMEKLMSFAESHPETELLLDVSALTLAPLDGPVFRLSMDAGRQKSLLEGSWDTLGEMLDNLDRTRDVRSGLMSHVS